MSRAKPRAQDRQGTAIVPADSPVFAPCGNAFALFRAADRLGICVQQDVQMDPVKNKAERSHALPRELWPILALIFTGPVLFVNVLLGGDRALQRAWIIALIGFACFGFLGRRNGHSTVIQRVNGNGATTPTESPSESKMRLAKTRNGGVRTRSTKGGMAGWVAAFTGLLAHGFITGVMLTLFPLARRDAQLTGVV